jgi:hypothetical protein
MPNQTYTGHIAIFIHTEQSLEGAIAIDSGSITDNTHITIYLSNTGQITEYLGSVYVDNVLIPATDVTFNGVPATSTTALSPGSEITIVITGSGINWADGVSHSVHIVANDGTSAGYSVHS